MGIVRDIGQDITDEELVNMGKGLNPNVKCIRVRRFNRRKTTEDGTVFVKTNTCVLTFEGTTLPKYFELYNIRLPVELYISPVVQCNKCLRYGHVRNLCRGRFRCRKCGSYHEDEKPCDAEPCCLFCRQGHEAMDRRCQEYLRQVKMREIMAIHNVSLYEADKSCKRSMAPNPSEFPLITGKKQEGMQNRPRNQTYASIVSQAEYKTQSSMRTNDNGPRLKRKAPSTVGYDKAEHEACLFSYRPASPTSHFSQSFSQATSVPPHSQMDTAGETMLRRSESQSQTKGRMYSTSQNDQSIMDDVADDTGEDRQMITYSEDYLRYGKSSPTY
ncbi:uncharacterized protein LOC123321972 [Coccinella septempunctata]|uniref:uncharacterized protein LOC123321972 n=1 Tax=Coccinella septempunctata TaxID=41139 RepID=UPI001D083749|nr:uncharacterized protein LOC123321972 [Coccinella septempunctata]